MCGVLCVIMCACVFHISNILSAPEQRKTCKLIYENNYSLTHHGAVARRSVSLQKYKSLNAQAGECERIQVLHIFKDDYLSS